MRSGPLAAAFVASTAVAFAAAQQHPQGNVARVIPHVVLGATIWTIAIWAVAGPRAATTVFAALAALGSLVVAAYVLAVEPIPYAECGVLIEEVGNPSCRRHASIAILLAATAAGGSATCVAGSMLAKRS